MAVQKKKMLPLRFPGRKLVSLACGPLSRWVYVFVYTYGSGEGCRDGVAPEVWAQRRAGQAREAMEKGEHPRLRLAS